MMHVTPEPFDGQCEMCSSQNVLVGKPGTALIQAVDSGRLSVVDMQMTRCERQHEYYVIDWSTQVEDPWLEGENPLEEGVELPPPPSEYEGE